MNAHLSDGVLGRARGRLAARLADEWAAKEARLLSELHPWQRKLAEDPHRRVCALVGRGGGKTTTLRARYVRRMKGTKRARCLYVATTRDQAIELLWNPLKDICDELGIYARYNETRLVCSFPENGSTLRLVGADDRRQIEKYRGQPFHEVWIDEAASYPADLLEHLLERIIGPRLGDFGGMLGMVGTPGHHLAGPFYDATRPGSDKHRPYDRRSEPDFAGWLGWSFHAWTLKDGAPYVPALQRLWDEALIEKADKGWSDNHPVWLREYMGQWAADDTAHVFQYRSHDAEGNLWNQWEPEMLTKAGLVGQIATPPDHSKEWHWVVSFDSGMSDPFALGAYAYSPTDPEKRLYHCYEFEKRQMYARPIAELLLGPDLDHDNPSGLIGAIGWPEAMVADAPETLLEELANVYGIRVKRADKRTETRFASIELTNGDFVDGRLKILKGSSLETQVRTNQWVHDDFGQVKKNKGQRDDQCFVAGTLIETSRGPTPIEEVAAGDLVWTRRGLRPVIDAACTGVRETWIVSAEGGSPIEGTPDHPIWTDRGWIPLARLTNKYMLTVWERTAAASSSSTEASDTAGTPTPLAPTCDATGTRRSAAISTGPSTKMPTAGSLAASTSTTQMEIPSTTTSATSSSSPPESTQGSTLATQAELRRHAGPSPSPERQPACGTDPRQGSDGTRSRARRTGRTAGTTRSSAPPAPSRSPANSLGHSSVAASAARSSVATAGSMTSSGRARSAAPPSCATSTAGPRTALLRVVGAAPSGRTAPVYNLTVEGEHEYFAGGILVHNCDQLIYGRGVAGHLMQQYQEAPKVEKKSDFHKVGREVVEEAPANEWDDMLAPGEFDDGDDAWG